MASPRESSAPAGGGNILTQRLGPLATWVWLLIGTLIIIAIALIMKKKSAASAAAAQAAPGQVAGVQQVPDIILQQYNPPRPQQHNPVQPPVTPPSQPAATPPPPAGPAPPTVKVPGVVGMRVNPAIAAIRAAGLTCKLSSTRNPASEYRVNSQTPGPGATVAKGSGVDLGIVKI
ncbi:MAG: PASTA domain-containing protein [Streptosporangiaceae bacterium]